MVQAKIENHRDLYAADNGQLSQEAVREVEVADAQIDTRATLLSLPKRFVERLGLRKYKSRIANTPGGKVEFGIYDTVRLTVQGRDCNIDVAEVPDICPVLIGQIPLELMDWVVDPVNQRLVGNAEHGGEQMMDMF